jgi:polysaccharide chain length determinant protein (PEP-CTERM system associated)
LQELVDQVLSQIRAAWRYRWYAVAVAWLVALGGWAAVYLTPFRYEAFARVYVDTQSMLRPLLTGLVVQPNIDQMVAMMSKTLVNRTNLEKVVTMAGLEAEAEGPGGRDKVLSRLGNEISIQTAGRENLYVISYVNENPDQAKRVVESMLSLFVEGSLGNKRDDSDQAQRFIDEQLKGLSAKLAAAEAAVTEFKRRHLGLMPDEGRDYYGRLMETQTTLRQAALELDEAEKSRDSIKTKLSSTYGDGGDGEPTVNPELVSRIQALEVKLDELRLKYTEQHPDVIALVSAIAQLKAQKEAEARQEKPAKAAISKDPVYQQLTVSLAAAEAKVASVKARVAEYQRRYAELRAAADAVPQVEAQYKQLTRDYDVIRDAYAKLLAKRESAQMSGDMAADASVVDFRIVDAPQVRLSPKTRSRPLLMSLVLLAAMGGGAGLAFLLSQLRPTFHDERRLREVSGRPVIGTVALAMTDRNLARRRRGLAAFAVSLTGLLSAYGAVMAALLLPAWRL